MAMVGLDRPFRRFLVGAAALLATGFLLHLALPILERSRAVAFALFLGLAFVVVGTSLVRFILDRSRAPDARSLSRIASVVLGLIALGYIVLGLMRLSGGPIEARLVVGMTVWIAMVVVAAVFVARFAGELEAPLRDLGLHELRGVVRPQRVFEPSDECP